MHVSNHQEVILHVTLEIDMYLSLMQNSCFVRSSLCLDNYFKLQRPTVVDLGRDSLQMAVSVTDFI